MPAARPSGPTHLVAIDSETEAVRRAACPTGLAPGGLADRVAYRFQRRHKRQPKDIRRYKYTRAREMQGHANAALAVESAVNAQDAGLGRLAYDALKWHASKLVPKVYGDKTEVAVTGPNGGPVQSQSVTVPVTDPIEAARIYQKIMGE
jgi:hypothetical protein